jgi:hypothetical protein
VGGGVIDKFTHNGWLMVHAQGKSDEGIHPHQDDTDIEETPVPFAIAIVGMAMRLPGGVAGFTNFSADVSFRGTPWVVASLINSPITVG